MDYKVLLDVAMPSPGAYKTVVSGVWWIVGFIIIAFAIAIVSVIIIRRGVKKAKMEAELREREAQASLAETTEE